VSVLENTILGRLPGNDGVRKQSRKMILTLSTHRRVATLLTAVRVRSTAGVGRTQANRKDDSVKSKKKLWRRLEYEQN